MKNKILIIFPFLLLFSGCALKNVHKNEENKKFIILNEKYNENPVLKVEKKDGKTEILPAWKSIKIEQNAIYATGKYPVINNNRYDSTMRLAARTAKLKVAAYFADIFYKAFEKEAKVKNSDIKTMIYQTILTQVPSDYAQSKCFEKICYVEITVNRSLMSQILFNTLRAEYPQYGKIFNKIFFNY